MGSPVYRLPPYTVEQVSLSLSETVDWSVRFGGLPDHWRNTKGEGVTVAVVDTGVDENHPDLKDAISDAKNFTRSRVGYRDRQGHGTHVAGTIGARQNDVGVIGVAPACKLLIAKALGDDGSGADSWIAAAIDWAVERGADVVSMSLGSPSPSMTIKAAVDRAINAGRFMICAAGNDGQDDSVNYPAAWPGPVIVGAINEDRHLAEFSSRGPEMRERGICAPGENVTSTYLNGSYAALSGTSMATPFVAGVTALCLARHRKLGEQAKSDLKTQGDLIEHLRRTAQDAGAVGPDDLFGLGIIGIDGLLGEQSPEQPKPVDGAQSVNLGPVVIHCPAQAGDWFSVQWTKQ